MGILNWKKIDDTFEVQKYYNSIALRFVSDYETGDNDEETENINDINYYVRLAFKKLSEFSLI